MAGRHRLPADVVKARGKKHLSEAEYRQRKAEEPYIPVEIRAVSPPEYLLDYPDLVARFDSYADMLAKVMPDDFCQLDAALLAQYVVFESEYESCTKLVLGCQSARDFAAVQSVQVKAYQNAKSAAASLGMFVTDRCRLSVRKPGDGDDDDGL